MDLPLASMSTLQSKAASADFAGNPALYESLIGFTPDYLTEAQRVGLGEVGVAVPARTPGRIVEAPPSGDDAIYQGAGLWFVQCAAQGGTIGLMISPLCAAIGAGLGAWSSESEENVKASSFAIRSVLEDYYSHQALRDRMVRVAAQSGAPALTPQSPPLPEDKVVRRGNSWRFDQNVDSVIARGCVSCAYGIPVRSITEVTASCRTSDCSANGVRRAVRHCATRWRSASSRSPSRSSRMFCSHIR
jgi:hypothetical protein